MLQPCLRLDAFARDRRGATAIITAVVLVLVAAAGFAVFDYTRIHGSRTQLQDSLDAATLAAARVRGDDRLAVTAGQDHLAAHLSAEEFKGLQATFTPSERTVRSTAEARIQPFFINMFMKGPVRIAVNSEVVRSLDGALELALVLDTTASMGFQNRMPDLKVAAKALVDRVTVVPDADVKIAVVPFANYVNVGIARRNEPWMNVPPDSTTTTENGPRTCETRTTRRRCDTEYYDCRRDGVLVSNGCSRNINCRDEAVTPYEVCTGGTSTSTTRFRGCVGSPPYPQNVTDSDPSRVYPGIMDATCTTELTPLTDNKARVRAAIDALTPANNTYIPAGLAWGLNVLSRPTPFTEGAAYDADNKRPRKALVLMSDGANTMLATGTGQHQNLPATANPVQADGYTRELCRNIKAQRIDLFTVGFRISDSSAHALLRDCATSESHYFRADDSAELLKAFEAIGLALENLRITR